MKQNYLMKAALITFAWLLFCLPTYAQQNGTLAGQVLDAQQQPIIGAAVVVRGTTTGGATDVDGKFLVENVKPGDLIVQISYLGYRTQLQEVKLEAGKTATLNITLEEDVQMLEEAVVIGYGTTQTRDLTGSVVAIPTKSFQQGNFATPEQMVIGKSAGVRITSNGGAPGAGSTIRIRGGTSLNASNDPLIVIDGVPLEGAGIAGAGNPLSLINPDDIETFTILKDASAAAIYGSRGANGVIIITTKKGKSSDKLRVEVSNAVSVKQVTRTVDMLNPDELRALIEEKGTPGMKTLIGQSNEETNWQNEIYQPGVVNNFNIAFSGGLKKVPYRLNFERYTEEGILRTGQLERTGATLNLNPTLLKGRLKVDATARYNNVQNRFADQGAIGSAVTFDPTRAPRSDSNRFERYNGFFEWTLPNGNPVLLAPKNPLAMLNGREDISNVNRFIGNVSLDYDITEIPGLRAVLNLGGDFTRSNGTVFVDSAFAGAFIRRGVNNQYEQSKSSRLMDAYLNYTKDWALHSLDITGGYSYQFWQTESPAFPDINLLGDTISEAAPFPFYTDNAIVSFYGRAIYKYLDKYLLTATLRSDGSSRFNPNGRWGYFPSVAVAWRMMDEDFFRQFKKLSNLKMRVSWGLTGQQDGIADYSFIPNYFQGTPTAQYQFGNQFVSVLRPQGYDANLKWETTQSYNGGIDFGFFNNRVYGTLDVYYKLTEDLLAVIPVPAGTNFTNQVLTNVGSMTNRGAEVSLNYIVIDNKTTSLEFGANVTYNINEITKLSVIDDPTNPGIQVGGIAGGIGNTIQIHSVGHARNTFYVRQQNYDEVTGKPIEGDYVDQNGDGIINEKDLVRFGGNPDPVTFFGFFGNARYKRWNAGFSLRAETGHYIYNNVRSNLGQFRNISGLGYINNVHRDYLTSEFANLQVLSDYYMEKADFLRLDNVVLGYNVGSLAKDLVQVRVSAMIQNVFVLTNYSGIDPEVGGGIDNNFYPRPRVYTMSINLTF